MNYLSETMKFSIIICCFVGITIAEKQLKLEDIERDNLASERQIKQEKHGIKYSQPYPSKTISSSQQFAFTPLKNPPKQVQIPQPPIQQTVQYVPQYPSQYVYQQPQYQQPQYQQLQYQQLENIPYVVDNNINQNSQYYTPQYVYLQQPYTSASNNIQMVIDTKGNVKYYMYVPNQYVSASKPEVSQVEQYRPDIPQNFNNVGPQIFTQEPDYQQAPNRESQYITQPQLASEPHAEAPQPQYIQQAKYVQKEPQSLLDSYVPSIVQLQYYKQQQAQANAIRSSFKPSAVQKATISSQQVHIPSAPSELTYSYQIPHVKN